VFLGLLGLGPEGCCAVVSLEIEQQTGRTCRLAPSIQRSNRLEDKRLIRSRLGEPTPQRGGKRTRHYEVLPAGVRALQQTLSSPGAHDCHARRPARRRSVTPGLEKTAHAGALAAASARATPRI
jgi:PadR family transcriptional regulator, regulatory protein PadR